MEEKIKQALQNLKIETLNEMQLATVSASSSNNDIILLSATGSGKTIAYLLTVLLSLDKGKNTTQAMVVVPSRELALQIEQVFKSMGTGFKITCCYGGHKREIEENNLLQAPALIIGTAGRLGDHLRRGNIQIGDIETLVLDEFDKSLELGFKEEMAFIVNSLINIKRKVLTSATNADEIPDFIELDNPLSINFLADQIENALELKVLRSEDKDKLDVLYKLICHLGNRSTIIFCNHRDAVERVSDFLADKGVVNVFYHGALEQQERESALAKFRNGTSNILVTTDLASRGLDIPNIRYIVHFHLPSTPDVFTHRNGRTARMEASGTAILVTGPDEKTPEYVPVGTGFIELPETYEVPEKPKWSTLFIAAGKKDKVNKVDIVGFLTNKGRLKKEDIGLIEVKDYFSFVAIRKSKIGGVLLEIKDEKIKNKKVKMAIAK